MRYWGGTIGGIPLLDGADIAGFELTGADAFVAERTGNSLHAASGFLHTQYEDYLYGKPLSLKFIHIPKTLASSLLGLLTPLLNTGGVVPCSFTDGWQLIEGDFKPHVPDWYRRGLPDGDYINDFELNLIMPGTTP